MTLRPGSISRSGFPLASELPDDRFVSSDYRLDAMTSVTLGVMYGIALKPNAGLRLRAEYVAQAFDSDGFDKNNAILFQASFKYQF